MHILYTDESEAYLPGDIQARYFLLVGVSVFERQTYWLSKELDAIAVRFNADEPQSVELHGSPMFGGKKFWRKQPAEKRISAIKDVLRVLAKSHSGNRIFTAIVEKEAVSAPPLTYAFEQLASRFDHYLGRISHQEKSRQTGMILFDKSAHEKTIQAATSVYRNQGHQWGQLKYFAEVPAFIDSQSSRLIQLADIIAYSISRKLAHSDEQFYKIIETRFDSDGSKTHGLHIKKRIVTQ